MLNKNLKTMKKIMFSALALSIVMLSCNKKVVEPNSLTGQETVNTVLEPTVIGDYDENIKNCVLSDSVKYFLNGKEVRPGTYNPADENLFGILHSPDEEMNNFYYFTNKEDYFQFGRDNGYANTLEGGYNFEQGMRAYIEQNNVEAYYEENGDYPDGYLEYERNLYQREVIGNEDRGLTWLFVNYAGSGSTTSVTGYKPFFASAQYNNAISRYKQFGSSTVVYGWMNVYDKKWYRQRLGVIGHITWQEVWFIGPALYLNDRMTSCIAL